MPGHCSANKQKQLTLLTSDKVDFLKERHSMRDKGENILR